MGQVRIYVPFSGRPKAKDSDDEEEKEKKKDKVAPKEEHCTGEQSVDSSWFILEWKCLQFAMGTYKGGSSL